MAMTAWINGGILWRGAYLKLAHQSKAAQMAAFLEIANTERQYVLGSIVNRLNLNGGRPN